MSAPLSDMRANAWLVAWKCVETANEIHTRHREAMAKVSPASVDSGPLPEGYWAFMYQARVCAQLATGSDAMPGVLAGNALAAEAEAKRAEANEINHAIFSSDIHGMGSG